MRTGDSREGTAKRAYIVPPLGRGCAMAGVNLVSAGSITFWSVKRLQSTWGRA